MSNKLADAELLLNAYNNRYHTTFVLGEKYRLFPQEEGEYGFKENTWPCNGRAGVYLILDDNDEVIYIGQSKSFGYRFYQYFKDDNGTCVVKSPYWSKKPEAIVAIPAPDCAQYERLSLEEYLISNMKPVDNIMGK